MYSRGQFLVSTMLGVTLAMLPHVSAAVWRVGRLGVLAAALVAVLTLGYRAELTGGPTREVVPTALLNLSKDVYASVIPSQRRTRGGAVEPYGDGFVVVTTDGDFYAVDWPDKNGQPRSRRLPLALPPDSVTAGEDPASIPFERLGEHRILDLKIDETATPEEVYVSTQEWNPTGRCYTVRVLKAAFTTAGDMPARPADAWTRIFESSPCLSSSHPAFKYLESGGRLGFYEGKLLLTVGDLGMGHVLQPAPSQSPDSSYGKVLLLDRNGGAQEPFTTGHRNGQGLLVIGTRVWQTEHGPQGGDELNLLERGRNYGWPLATYGTEYGRQFWPLAPRQHDHGEFAEPVHVFVPSIAVSNLIRVEADAFPEWRRDLLLGSLNTATLYRVRMRDDRVVYVEPIPMSVRIRDLAEGADGRLVLWTDGGALVSLTPGPTTPIGNVVFARCRTCHESPPGPESLGPPIRGIAGAPVARDPGFRYSPALSRLGGRWTDERLDAFLKNPNAFVPGTLMTAGQVPDDQERRAVIEFLKTYK
jgi:cytochrome c2